MVSGSRRVVVRGIVVVPPGSIYDALALRGEVVEEAAGEVQSTVRAFHALKS